MLKDPNNDKQVHEWCRATVEDGLNLRLAYEFMWWENLAFYAGDIWAEFNPHDRRLYELPRPKDKARLTINLTQPVVRTEYAKLLKNRPIVNCVAGSSDKRDLNSAEVGDKALNQYADKKFKKARIRRQALMWTLICGLGGVFTDYDETAQAEIQLPADNQGNPVFDTAQIKSIQRYYRDKQHRRAPTVTARMGELRYAALSPWQMIWDFAKLDPAEASWLVITEVFDCLEVMRRWGVMLEPRKNVQPNVLEYRMLNRIDFTKKLDFNRINSQDLVELHRMFVRPGHYLFPKGVEIVFTDDELVDVKDYPFMHGELPVSTMGHIPFPGARYPLSVMSQIKDPVLELSKTESQLVDNRNMMSNPAWLEYDQNGIPDGAIQNKPGLRIKIQWRPGVPEPHPVEMPQLPGYINDLITLLRDHTLEISGQGETSQGKIPAGARSGVAIAYLQEEDDTKLGPTVQEYEEMIERESWQTLQLMAQFYEIPRTISIYKRNAAPEVIDFYGSMLQGVDHVDVQAGSALPRSKAARQQFMFDLWDRGVVQDPRELMEMLELNQKEAADWETDIEQAERENARMAIGQDANVLEWFNHTVHQYTHRKHMKSAEFESYSEDVKQVWYDHDEMHTQAIRQAQMQQAALQMVTGGGGQQPPNGQPQLASANGMNQPQGQMPGAPVGPPMPQNLQDVEPQ